MNVAPLQLNYYFITDLRITARYKFDTKKEQKYSVKNLNSDVKYLRHKKEPKKWQVTLNLKYTAQPDENIPYEFAITIIGLFEVHKKRPDAEVIPLVHINAPAILYSSAREVIATMTGRGPWDSILLPSVNFLPETKRMHKRSTKKKRVRKTK
jgi:preprotein translocase subunit SecB